MCRSSWMDKETERSGCTSWSTKMNPNSYTFCSWSLFSQIRETHTRTFRWDQGEISFTGVACIATFLSFLQDNCRNQVWTDSSKWTTARMINPNQRIELTLLPVHAVSLNQDHSITTIMVEPSLPSKWSKS
jgi:hypothetical protein